MYILKYTLKNIRASLKGSAMLCGMFIVCTACAVFAVIFSHGVYQNYSSESVVEDISKKQMGVQISFGENIIDEAIAVQYDTNEQNEETETTVGTNYIADGTSTIGQLREALGLLDEKTKESFSGGAFVINYEEFDEYLSSDIEFYPPVSELCCRLEYDTEARQYGLYRKYCDNVKLLYGRLLTQEEELSGAHVAVVPAQITDPEDSSSAIETPKEVLGQHIKLFGEDYEIIGVFDPRTPGGFQVPFVNIPDGLRFSDFTFLNDKVITTQTYDKIKQAFKEIYGDEAHFPVFETVDETEFKFYSTVVMTSVVLSMVAAITLAILFRYIVYERRRTIAVLRLSGLTRSGAVIMFLIEVCGISTLIYLVCAAVYHHLLLSGLTAFLPKIREVYSLRTYCYIYGVFIGVLMAIMAVMLVRNVEKQPVDMVRKAGVMNG